MLVKCANLLELGDNAVNVPFYGSLRRLKTLSRPKLPSKALRRDAAYDARLPIRADLDRLIMISAIDQIIAHALAKVLSRPVLL